MLLTAFLRVVRLCASHAQTVLRTDTNDLREIRLDEVVVTGTGTEHYLKDAPVQTEVITGKALEQYNGRSLDEILSASPLPSRSARETWVAISS